MAFDLTITRGDSATLDLTITDDDGAVDLTGAELAFTAKRSAQDVDADAVISKTSVASGGIAVTSASGGTATVAIDPDDTSALEADTITLICDVQMVSASGVVTTVASGYVTVLADITKAS